MRPDSLRWRTRGPLLLGAGILVLSLGHAPARAELAPGAQAVQVDAKEFVNTEPVALLELKGRVILLELFSTT